MRHLIWLPVLLLLAGCDVNRVPPASEWQSFTTSNGLLTLKFPGEPRVIEKPLSLPQGEVTGEFVAWEGKKLVFMANALKLPGEADDTVETAEVLDQMANGAAGAVNGRIAEQTDVTIDGIPGRELYVEVPDGPVVRARILLLRDVPAIVSLQVLAATRAETNGQAGNDFLDNAVVTP